MRKWFFLPILFATAILLPVTACSSDDDSASVDSDSQDSGSDSGSGSDSDSGSLGDNLPSEIEESVDSLLDEANEALDGIGDIPAGIGDCVDISLALGKIYVATVGGEQGMQDAQDAADELKDLVPSELDDDIDVIAKGIGTVAEEGFAAGGDAMNTEEFNSAMDAVSDYVNSECQTP